MIGLKKILGFVGLMVICFFFVGCDNMKNVPSDKIGMILTPTGWEQTVYPPGQVDVGQTHNDGSQNMLYLIQRSGFDIKESFAGRESNEGKEDHRCVTGKDKSLFTLDVRLLLALPDYSTDSGKKDLSRIFALGNPEVTADNRVMHISAKSVYEQQAQQVVRNKIRIVCASYNTFDDVWNAYLSEDFQKKIQGVISKALVDSEVPLHIVSAFPSNLKQDEAVVAATTAQQSVSQRLETVKIISDFLDKDPTGNRRLVYQLQTLQEIANVGNTNGHNTIVIPFGGNTGILPLPQK